MIGQGTNLSVEAVLAAVASSIGVADTYAEGLGDRLARLLVHLDEEVGLDEAGKRAAFDNVVGILTSRALLLRDREVYPEIADEVIERPIIVAGLGRSGTTLAHALLGQHPENRLPLHWEVVSPSPPPGISAHDDPRIAHVSADIANFIRKYPNQLAGHPYFDLLAVAPMECAGFEALDLRNTYPLFWWNVPAVLNIGLGGDDVAVYEWQRLVLQNLQWRREPRRWVLKGLHHHARLGALKQVFPDSIVVWMHRDPLKVVPSMIELLCGYYEAMSPVPIDRPAIARLLLSLITSYIDAGMASPYADDPGVYHMLYADFTKDQVGQIRSLYEHYGMPFDTTAERAIQSWLDDPANRGDRHGKFKYSLEPFDITPEELDDLLSEYRSRFAIPYE